MIILRTLYLYQAFDGKIFTDEIECENYENVHLHVSLFNITFYNKQQLSYTLDKRNIYDDSIYNECEQIEIPKESFEDFQWWVQECGWCEFEQITKPGKWKRTVTEESSIYNEGIWIYIGEE